VIQINYFTKLLVAIILFIAIQFDLSGQINFPNQSTYSYLKGSEASGLAGNWMDPGFNDASWATGNAPFRYGDGTGGTEIADMENNYSTLYLRSSFNAVSVVNINEITFTVDYDDGFVIWINGEIVLSMYAPTVLSYDAFATELHESGTPETFVVNAYDVDLVEGVNTIAVQGFNENLASTDFYFDMTIQATPDVPRLIDTIGIGFNHNSGFYSSPFNLTITSPDPQADIIYTLDGSNPENSVTSYTVSSPATVFIDPASTTGRGTTPGVVLRASLTKNGYKPSYPAGRTFIYISNVLNQTYPGGDWPNSNINGQIIDYDMASDVLNDSRYSNLVDDALLDIPTISVITDNKNLFDPSTGIYVNADGHGEEWERECTVELIYPDGSEGFNVNAGLRIRGGWSRHPDFPKHAFRLFFRSEYGDPKLEYPLFDDEGVSEFDKIDLRTSQNYAWSVGDSRNTMVREVFSRDLQRDMGQPYTRSRYYHLYLNGMYWGLFQTQERSEARYASDYLGDSKEDYDVVKVNTEDWSYRIEATDGVLTTWQNIYTLVKQGFEDNSRYFFLEGKNENGVPVSGRQILVDIDNLIDYMLTIFYTGNFDAPTSSFGQNNGPNNFYAIFNRSDKKEGFVFFNHDAEHALFVNVAWPGVGINEDRVNIGTRTDEYQMQVSSFSGFHPQWLHFKLCDNEEYRLRFADRAAMYLTGNGAMTPTISLNRFNSRVMEIQTAIIAESARWGDAKTGSSYTKDDHWLPEINRVRTGFFPVRTDIVINQLKEADLFTNLFAPKIYVSGNPVYEKDYPIASNIEATIDNPNSGGTIYYTLDGNDPRIVGGEVSSSAIDGGNEVALQIGASTIIKARILNSGHWSAICHINFFSDADDFSYLKVTELHYHPTDLIFDYDTLSGKDFEFIEFKNTGETSLNLSGFVLDSAVHYEFPQNTILPPQGFYVIASKPSLFYYRYGKVTNENFSGNFSNSGEEVLLNDSEGNEIIHFIYDDHNPWPEEPDGDGPSMVSIEINPTGNPASPYYWRASYRNGSPFKDDDFYLGIEDPEPEKAMIDHILVYPNPTQGELTVIRSSYELSGKMRVKMYSLQGVLLEDITSSEDEMDLDLRELNLESGMYILQVQFRNEMITKRIVYHP